MSNTRIPLPEQFDTIGGNIRERKTGGGGLEGTSNKGRVRSIDTRRASITLHYVKGCVCLIEARGRDPVHF